MFSLRSLRGRLIFILSLSIGLKDVTSVDIFCTEIYSGVCGIEQNVTLHQNDSVNIVNSSEWRDVNVVYLRAPVKAHVVPAAVFKAFPKLVEIRLRGLQIIRLTGDVFEDATALKELDLGQNQITKLPVSTFAKAKNLTEIHLESNFIDEIEDDAFEGLPNVANLNLAGNRLTILKRNTLRGLKNLEMIGLGRNQLETIEEGALDFPLLESVNLSLNKLVRLPMNLFSVSTSVRFVFLEINQLNHIGEMFYKMSELRFLGLSRNPIDDIDLIRFAKQPKLMWLWLAATGYKFPPKIEWANRVKAESLNSSMHLLDLSENDIDHADILERLAIFPTIGELYLDHNRLNSIDHLVEFPQLLPQLHLLSVEKNPFNCTWFNDVKATLNSNFEQFLFRHKRDGSETGCVK